MVTAFGPFHLLSWGWKMDLGTIDLAAVQGAITSVLSYIAPVLAIVVGFWAGARVFGYLRRQFR